MIKTVRLLPFLLALPAAAAAQEAPRTVLVLDASGSMWGQIEGTAKIEIARDVMADLVGGLPSEQELGLTAYGHNRKGDCSDIELLVPPGPGTREAISAAVAEVKPRGKTPMTDAIVSAAQALRYTEEKATVILVSDGIETCNPDPCAAAAALEEAGVDFTAHVVGFDVTDPEALAQMQCIAEETGGTFRSASDASELAEALTTVAVAPEPEPAVVVDMTFEARLDAENGPLVEGPVLWTLSPLPENVAAEEEGNGLELSMEEGSYEVTAAWLAGEAEQTKQFIATAGRTLIVVFDSPPETATVTAPSTAVAGSTIEISWNGPQGKDDYIGIGEVDAEGSAQWANFVYASEESPAELLVPMTTGPHQITYFKGGVREVLGSAMIDVTPVDASITAPAEAEAGSTIEIAWTGPIYDGDYIGIGEVDADGSAQWENFVYANTANPGGLLVPGREGQFEITYFAGQDRTPLSTIPITVTKPEVSVTAPATAVAGSTIEIGWVGPDANSDYIGIGAQGATGSARWRNFAYTADGAPAQLLVPPEPGTYEIAYFLGQDRTALVTTTLEVTAPEVSVTAPSTAIGGSTIEVAWVGPNAKSDYIGVGLVGASGSAQWQSFAYTADGAPAKLRLPTSGGEYVIQYFLSQDRTAMASAPITVTTPEATITAPTTATAGTTIEVGWSGPDYKSDYLGIGLVGETGSRQWSSFAYTSGGSPAKLTMPEAPGNYVIQYFAGTDRISIQSATIKVE